MNSYFTAFVLGSAFWAIQCAIRFLMVWFAALYFREDFRKNFDFSIMQFCLELAFFGTVFALIQTVFLQFDDERFVSFVGTVLLVAIWPTYNFVVQPFFYLLTSRELRPFSNDSDVTHPELTPFRIKIIDKNIINAYATGVVPFSKTILVGRPLLSSLSKSELLSIMLHEAGHLHHKHTRTLFGVNLLLSVPYAALLHLRFYYMDFDTLYANVAMVSLLGGLYGGLLYYIPGKVQYHLELQADSYAARRNGKENMLAALRKLDEVSNGVISQGGITHPKLSVRLANIEKSGTPNHA